MQDLSIAKANRKGLEGERSSLFYEYVRLLKESKPTWFIMENVARMPKDARDVITAELGVEPVMIDAGLVSAQRRQRLFWTNIPIVGLPDDRALVLDDILETGPVPSRFDEDKPFTPKKGASASRDGLILVGHRGEVTGSPQHARVYSPKGKARTLTATRCREVIILSDEQMRKLTPKECERLQGLDDDYTLLTGTREDTHRFHAIGNAFHADVVAWILSSACLTLSEFSDITKAYLIEVPFDTLLHPALLISCTLRAPLSCTLALEAKALTDHNTHTPFPQTFAV